MKVTRVTIDEKVNLILLEAIELSFGLIILNIINSITGSNIQILKSIDYLVAVLIYSCFSLRNFYEVSLTDWEVKGIQRKLEVQKYSNEGSIILVMVALIGIFILIAEIIKFKLGNEVNFLHIHVFTLYFFIANITCRIRKAYRKKELFWYFEQSLESLNLTRDHFRKTNKRLDAISEGVSKLKEEKSIKSNQQQECIESS